MTVCRIDDADRLHATYQNKMTSGTALTIVLSMLILFVGLIVYGVIATSYSGKEMLFILIMIPVLIGLVLIVYVYILNVLVYVDYAVSDTVYQCQVNVELCAV